MMSKDGQDAYLNSFDKDIESKLEDSGNSGPTGSVQRIKCQNPSKLRKYAINIALSVYAALSFIVWLTIVSPVIAEKVVTFIFHITDVESKKKVLYFLVNCMGLYLMTLANAYMILCWMHLIFYLVYGYGDYFAEEEQKSQYRAKCGPVKAGLVFSTLNNYGIHFICKVYEVEVLQNTMYFNSLTFSSFVYFLLLAAPIGYWVISIHRRFRSEVSQSVQ